MEAVLRAVREVEFESGASIHIEAIEYVPDDAPRYDLYLHLARKLCRAVLSDATGEEQPGRS